MLLAATDREDPLCRSLGASLDCTDRCADAETPPEVLRRPDDVAGDALWPAPFPTPRSGSGAGIVGSGLLASGEGWPQDGEAPSWGTTEELRGTADNDLAARADENDAAGVPSTIATHSLNPSQLADLISA
jgi:hypothetical protein